MFTNLLVNMLVPVAHPDLELRGGGGGGKGNLV